jgi:hypothetical protein
MVRINAAERRRVVLHQQLSLVLRDIEAGARKIAKQREMIAKLAAGGSDTSKAARELAIFERAHVINISRHRQITKELGARNDTS